jgi:hypothetical protein
LTSALRPIHSERCFESLRKVVASRTRPKISPDCWGIRLLNQFDPRAIDIVRGLVKGATRDLNPEIHDLKYDLVIVATIMERTFPEYEQWLREAKRDKLRLVRFQDTSLSNRGQFSDR